MSTKSKIYAHQALAATGFALMHSMAAWRLRPDLWPTGQECALDLKRNLAVDDTIALVADIEGIGPARVLTRSTDMLVQRIQWVTGLTVHSIESEKVQDGPKRAERASAAQQQHDENLEKLKRLAQQEPPTHECNLRREILRARALLEQPAC